MQRNRYLYICIYSQSQCKFGKLMFKLTSIFPPLSLSGSSTYSSFTLQWMEKRKKKVRDGENRKSTFNLKKCGIFIRKGHFFLPWRHAIVRHFNSRGLIFCQIARREHLCISAGVISFLSHPYQVIAYYTLPRGWRMHKDNFLSQIWLHSLVTTLAGQNTL